MHKLLTRETVFTVMGMTPTTINPDCSKAVFNVYAEAAESVELENGYVMLRGSTPTRSRTSVMDPRLEYPSPDYLTRSRFNEQSGLSNTQSSKLQLKTIRQDGKSLIIIGTLFDTIFNLTAEATSNLNDVPDTTTATSSFVTRSMEMATQQCKSYSSSKPGLCFAFWQTLMPGKEEYGRLKAPANEFAPIFALLFDCATGHSASMADQPTPNGV